MSNLSFTLHLPGGDREDYHHLDVECEAAGVSFTAQDIEGKTHLIVMPWHTFKMVAGFAAHAQESCERRRIKPRES